MRIKAGVFGGKVCGFHITNFHTVTLPLPHAAMNACGAVGILKNATTLPPAKRSAGTDPHSTKPSAANRYTSTTPSCRTVSQNYRYSEQEGLQKRELTERPVNTVSGRAPDGGKMPKLSMYCKVQTPNVSRSQQQCSAAKVQQQH